MDGIRIDLSKLHGFRLLAATGSSQKQVLNAESLPQMLGARLGTKVGNIKLGQRLKSHITNCVGE